MNSPMTEGEELIKLNSLMEKVEYLYVLEVEKRPHHRFLHYEFLTLPEQRWITSAKESFIPADGKEARRAENIATLQLFRFNIDDGDNTDKPFKKNIPYFRLYCPKVLGTRFMAKKL